MGNYSFYGNSVKKKLKTPGRLSSYTNLTSTLPMTCGLDISSHLASVGSQKTVGTWNYYYYYYYYIIINSVIREKVGKYVNNRW